MRIRLTKVDEYQFLTCVKHGLWGSKNARFADWQIGDHLAIIVDKQIAGVAVISGDPLFSQERVWDNGIFPNRIPLKFKYLFEKESRPQILGSIRDNLIREWTPKYGWGILNQRLIEGDSASSILREIESRPAHNDEILVRLDDLLLEARAERETEKKRRVVSRGANAERPIETTDASDVLDVGPRNDVPEEQRTQKEESLHSKAQFLLARIGAIVGCKNFIASNDRKRTYKQTKLGSMSVLALPNLGLNTEATSRISLIDVIWLKQNAPMCAFEVETSTSVYSGLLRMSDLVAVVPALNLKLYIVAQAERRAKVLSELSRPTFRKIGLNDYCEFISIEDLEGLLGTIENLSGHIQPTILSTIAVGVDDPDS